MKIICSWCRQEGKAEFVGEKAPLADARETHGKRMGFAWPITAMLKLIWGHRFARIPALEFRPDGLLRSFERGEAC